MSKGINKVIVLGFLGQDPEVRHTPNGTQVTTLSVATSESWKDKNTGEQKEQTEWHRIVFFNKLAEIAGQYLKKGSQVYVEGSLKTRKWQDKDGQDRYTTEIVASELQMIGGKSGSSESDSRKSGQAPARQAPARQAPARQAPASSDDFQDDDVPF